MLITHTSESIRNSLVDKTTPKLIIHLVLDFHFFGENKLSIAKKWRHTSMTHSPPLPSKNQKICNGRMTNGTTDRLIRSTATEKILWADRFLPPLPCGARNKMVAGIRSLEAIALQQQPARAFILSFEIIRGKDSMSNNQIRTRPYFLQRPRLVFHVRLSIGTNRRTK
jgi:hypothetical protein